MVKYNSSSLEENQDHDNKNILPLSDGFFYAHVHDRMYKQ